MNKQPRVSMIGSFMVDLIAKSTKFPLPGETIFGDYFSIGCGGKGSNQAIAAARLGAKVEPLIAIGKDYFGNLLLDTYLKESINTKNVIRSDTTTGAAIITVNNEGENSIIVIPGANNTLAPRDVDNAEGDLHNSEVLLIQQEIPLDTVVYSINWAVKNSILTVFDPSPPIDLPSSLYKDIYVITPNELEANALTGIVVNNIEKAQKAALKLLRMGCSNAVVTLGKNGAVVASKDGCVYFPGIKVDAIDSTGAGDSFNGALATCIAKGMDIFKAVEFSNVCASLSVTRMGAASGMPTMIDVEEFCRSHDLSI